MFYFSFILIGGEKRLNRFDTEIIKEIRREKERKKERRRRRLCRKTSLQIEKCTKDKVRLYRYNLIEVSS